MAQKRMLDKKISLSEQIAELPVVGQLFFTWMIPHTDDFGILPGSPRKLKALVIPFVEVSHTMVTELLKQMVDLKLLRPFVYKDAQYYKIAGFDAHQTLKRDRQPQCILEIELEESAETSWKKLTEITETTISKGTGIQMEDNGFQMESKWKTMVSKSQNVDKSQVEDNGFQMDPIPPTLEPEEKRREDNIYLADPKKNLNPETGGNSFAASQPTVNTAEQKAGMLSLAKVLASKGKIVKVDGKVVQPDSQKKSGIHTEWQDKAFRYAKELKIELGKQHKGRWLKAFKQAAEGRNKGNLEKAFSYLVDYALKPLSNEEKIQYFFYIFENGVRPKSF